MQLLTGMMTTAAAPNVSFETNLCDRFFSVRHQTESICEPLATEDYVIQSMPDVSPPKWHLGHTSWFFERLILVPFLKGYRCFRQEFDHLFNSYYQAVGEPFERPHRGLLSRPGVEEIKAYRKWVDQRMGELLAQTNHPDAEKIETATILGLHHEQQHQELLVTDIKHIFWTNPLHPALISKPRPSEARPATEPLAQLSFIPYSGGLIELGYSGEGFAYDNEKPAHKVYLVPFELASRPVTNGEFLEFIEAGGYASPRYWLSDGWDRAKQEGWTAPLYWQKSGEQWWQLTLSGMRPLELREPVCHVSYYEAAAFARFKLLRLPTEAEWELAATACPIEGNFLESGQLHPTVVPGPARSPAPKSLFGNVWEWTQSAYLPYPGFQEFEGLFAEYNGKFMCNQMVLRGGSCATPATHLRATYRNFFYPSARWQFSGIRLAR